MRSRLVVLAALCLSSLALAQPRPPNAPQPPMPPPPPGMPHHPPGPMPFMGPAPVGIPPAVAQKVGLSPEVTKKVRDASFDANEQLITLEAELKRAQLDLEKTLANQQVDESAVMNKLEVVSRAELAVRKNRMGLLVRIRKLVGPEAWDKLQAEMPGPGPGMMMMMGPGGGQMRREVRIIRGPDGEETINVHGD